MTVKEEILKLSQLIHDSRKQIVFLTGAGISVASGIPDYRSKTGVYANLDSPEYMLSHTCLINEPQKFYEFVMASLYFPDAEPNIVHHKIAEWESLNHNVSVITQNVVKLCLLNHT